MPKLIVTQVGTGEETPFDMSGHTSIGRQPDNDLQLEGEGISRKHAKILFENGKYYLVDLQSGNGTHLNGIVIKPNEKVPLRHNDRIQIENFRLRFVSQENVTDEEEKTDGDILEIKLLKKVLDAVDQDRTPSLEILNGTVQGKRFFLTDDVEEMIIGREPTSDFVIDEFVISRQHAKIVKKWGGINLIDLESKNGTFINNRKITEDTLHDGDRIAFGTIVLLFRNPQEISIRALSEEMEKEKQKEKPPSAEEANRETREMLEDLPPIQSAPANIYPTPNAIAIKRWTAFELGMIGLGIVVFCFSLLTLINLILEE